MALGVLNLVGVSYLSALLGTTSAAALGMTQASFAAATGLLPFLQAYAVSFFAIPLVRAVLNALRNARENPPTLPSSHFKPYFRNPRGGATSLNPSNIADPRTGASLGLQEQYICLITVSLGLTC